jgi:hypothetical protein
MYNIKCIMIFLNVENQVPMYPHIHYLDVFHLTKNQRNSLIGIEVQ